MSSPEHAPRPQPEKKSAIARVLENARKFDANLSASERVSRTLNSMETHNTDDRARLFGQAVSMLEQEKKHVVKLRQNQELHEANRHERELVGSGDDAQEILGAA